MSLGLAWHWKVNTNGCDLIVSRREVSVLEIVRQGVSLDLAGNWKVKA